MMSNIISSQVGFLPTLIPDLFQWSSWRRSGFTLNGSSLAQWNDLSGNGNHWVQGTSTNQPLFTATLEGTTVPTFDGVDNFMNSTLSFAKGNWSFFVLFKTTDLRGSMISRDDSGFNDVDTLFGIGRQNQFTAANGLLTFERHTSGPDRDTGVSSVLTYDDDVLHFAGFVVDEFDVDLYVDDLVFSASGDIAQCFKGTTIRMGTGVNGGPPEFAGTIAETVAYDRAISVTEAEYIRDYMKRMGNI